MTKETIEIRLGDERRYGVRVGDVWVGIEISDYESFETVDVDTLKELARR